MVLGGWMNGWVDGRAGLRIAYSNQKESYFYFECDWIIPAESPIITPLSQFCCATLASKKKQKKDQQKLDKK